MWSAPTLVGLFAVVLGTLTGALLTETLRARSWFVSASLVVAGIVCELVANAFVAGIVVSAFGGLVVVWSAVLASRRGERVLWFGVVLIALGCAGTAVSSPPPEKWSGFQGPVVAVVALGATASAVFALAPTLNSLDASVRPGCVGGAIRVCMRTIEQSLSNAEFGVAAGVAVVALAMGASHALMLVRALRTTRAFVVNAVLVPTQVVVGTTALSVAFSELQDVSSYSMVVLVLSLASVGVGTFVAQLRAPKRRAVTPLTSRGGDKDKDKDETDPDETTRLSTRATPPS